MPVLDSSLFASFAHDPEVPFGKDECYRPHYHFAPRSGWMNDPNGLYYHDGLYHLFFQHYPDDIRWGPMHWGHATSLDLIVWTEHPIALYPQGAHYIFSGSAVVDHGNTSGFGDDKTPPVVAVFTLHDSENANSEKIDVETQGLAWSLDGGMNWIHYQENPVLQNPGIRDFRDPKVAWDELCQHWRMSVAAHDLVYFYASKNLKDWIFLSKFGMDVDAHDGVWECPDLFQIDIAGTDQKKWILLVSLTLGGPNGGSATQYFVGDFDGCRFMLDPQFVQQLRGNGPAWLDWGRDHYAGVVFNHAPHSHPVLMGWMSNWQYGQEVPTKGWRSSATIARELTLENTARGWQLKSHPISSLQSFYHPCRQVERKGKIKAETLLLDVSEIDLGKAVMCIALQGMEAGVYRFILANRRGETLSFGIDNIRNLLFTDRQNAGNTRFSKHFADKVSTAPLDTPARDAYFEILLDVTSIELFFNRGERVMSHLFFPNVPFSELSLSSSTEAGTFVLVAHELLLD